MSWADSTDRDLVVSGRRSPRFYAYAARWMAGEVAAHKLRAGGAMQPIRMAKAYVNSRVGRLGMRLTDRTVADAPARPIGAVEL
jgi:hypothetical protein